MPSTQPNNPVLHCTVKDFLVISFLARRIILKGIYFNTSVFTTPPITLAVFKDALEKLVTLISKSRGNTTMNKLRTAQCKVVFGYLGELLLYTKVIANHDIIIIGLSGFDANSQPGTVDAPDIPIIKRVSEGKVGGTYKVYLTRKKNSFLVRKNPKTHSPHIKYSIEVTTTPDDDSSWVRVLEGKPKTKLVFTGLVSGSKYHIRVYGVNATGKGNSSTHYPFTPQ